MLYKKIYSSFSIFLLFAVTNVYAQQHCFTGDFDDVCFSVDEYSHHFKKPGFNKIKKTGASVTFCFNQNVQEIDGVVQFSYEHIHPDQSKDSGCDDGVFSLYLDQYFKDGTCVQKHLKGLQPGFYSWVVTIGKSYTGAREKIKLTNDIQVRCANCN